MEIWGLLLIVVGAGGIGGTINALISDNGFTLPKRQEGILRPGWLGNALVGAVSAAISWSLYGPLAGVPLIAVAGVPTAKGNLTVAAVGGAILVGVAGARWLSSEVDKSLLRAAGVEVAKKQQLDDVAKKLSTASPAAALQAAQAVSGNAGPQLVRQ